MKRWLRGLRIVGFSVVGLVLSNGVSVASDQEVTQPVDQPITSSALPEGYRRDLLPKTPQRATRSLEALYITNEKSAIRYYRDLDSDSVQDRNDHCLNTDVPIALMLQVDNRGCELDSDQDGVFNRYDYCPKTPLGIAVNFLGCEGDEDRDGVLDSKDQCPGTPYGVVVDAVGCKKILDSDGDGVLDDQDMCPNTPKGAEVNRHGCQPRHKVVSNIVFNTGSFEIRADQKDILDRQVSQLASLAEGEVLLITGYTDNHGCEEGNIKLSWNRAQSTKDYLVKQLHMIPSRIYVLGRGSARPVASNDTKEGRQKNRRIELEIIPAKRLPRGAKQIIPEKMTDYVWAYCRKRGLLK